MGLMGTLAKVAIGYASARGVDQLAGGGLGGLLGGAQVPSGEAEAGQNPIMEQLQNMMGGSGAGGGLGNMQEMLGGLMGGASGAGGAGLDNIQDMLGGLMGGGAAGGAGGIQDLMSQMLGGNNGGGAGLAGLLAMAGGAAAAGGGGMASLMDQFNTKETMPEAEASAGLMLRAMIQAAKADGEIDPAEQAKIMDLVGEDADADDIAFVKDQLAAPVDIAGLAEDTPAPMAMQVYSMSLMSIRVDTAAEAQYLDKLASALGLDQQTANALHAQMGVKPLYS